MVSPQVKVRYAFIYRVFVADCDSPRFFHTSFACPGLLWSDRVKTKIKCPYTPGLLARCMVNAFILLPCPRGPVNKAGGRGSAATTMINLLFAGSRMTTDPSGAASLYCREFWFPISHSPVEVSPLVEPVPSTTCTVH